MVVIEAMSSRPRIQRFWIRCQRPESAMPTAGAITDMVVRLAAASAALRSCRFG